MKIPSIWGPEDTHNWAFNCAVRFKTGILIDNPICPSRVLISSLKASPLIKLYSALALTEG